MTLHGSWNRGKRTGYKVVRLLFKNGKPTGAYFGTGFVDSDAKVWGRPVGIAVAPDGSVFMSDDGSGTIWRIAKRANLCWRLGVKRSTARGKGALHFSGAGRAISEIVERR